MIDGRKLAHLVTDQDRRAAKRKGYNPYALAMMLAAADEVVAACNGEGDERAFAKRFTPTRGNHAMARKLGLNLDVQRGQWEYARAPNLPVYTVKEGV